MGDVGETQDAVDVRETLDAVDVALGVVQGGFVAAEARRLAKRLLRDDDENVRLAAAKALGTLRGRQMSTETAAALAARLEDKDEDDEDVLGGPIHTGWGVPCPSKHLPIWESR